MYFQKSIPFTNRVISSYNFFFLCYIALFRSTIRPDKNNEINFISSHTRKINDSLFFLFFCRSDFFQKVSSATPNGWLTSCAKNLNTAAERSVHLLCHLRKARSNDGLQKVIVLRLFSGGECLEAAFLARSFHNFPTNGTG